MPMLKHGVEHHWYDGWVQVVDDVFGVPRTMVKAARDVAINGENRTADVIKNTQNDLRDVASNGLSIVKNAEHDVGFGVKVVSFLPIVLAAGLVVVLTTNNGVRGVQALGAAVRR